MPWHRFRRLTAAIVGIVGIVGSDTSPLSIATAQARPEGEPQPCGNCHYEPRGPEIKASFSNDTPDPNETITITIDLTARTANARRTGLMIQSTGGTFELIEADSTKRESETEVLHKMPRDLVDRKAQFQFRWQAPNEAGVTDFNLFSISSNDSGDASTYNAADARASIAHGCDADYYYPDDDGDGYGDESQGQLSCEPIDDWIMEGGDCNDGDPLIYPGATERCNALDDDCNGETDEGLDPGLYYRDEDGDGWGANTGATMFACNDTPNLANRRGDCDDKDPDIHPDAEEICDGEDNDCDGEIDNVPDGCDGNPAKPPGDRKRRRGGGCGVVQSTHSNDIGTLWGLGLGLMLALARGRSAGKPVGRKHAGGS